MTKPWFLLLLLGGTASAQFDVQLSGEVGGAASHKVPYVIGTVEPSFTKGRFRLDEELILSPTAKPDVPEAFDFSLATRTSLDARVFRCLSLGGGVSYSKQWTSLYDKAATRAFAEGRCNIVRLEYFFPTNDPRNHLQGLETRVDMPIAPKWYLRFRIAGYRLNATDQAKRVWDMPVTVGIVYDMFERQK